MLSFTVLLVASSFAAASNCTISTKIPADPCGYIHQKCISNGFVVGKWAEGYGFYKHCYDPIRDGVPRTALTDIRSGMVIPEISNEIVQACQKFIPTTNCRKIEIACLKNGFVGGKWQEGYGLGKHCIDPIRRGIPRSMLTDIKPSMVIPTIPAEIIDGCLKENPFTNCELIEIACQKNGFVGGKWQEGYGLYKHCIDPIRRGIPKSMLTDIKPNMEIPTISADVVKECIKEKPFGSCEKIAIACLKNGFVGGKWQEGYGLIKHCVDPIRRGITKNQLPDIKPNMVLPTVAADVIADCLKENPIKNCEKVEVACVKAGFVPGKYEYGNGLWVQCINPIMQKVPQDKVPGVKAGLTIPTFSEDVVSGCLTENANFGKGDVGFKGKLLVE